MSQRNHEENQFVRIQVIQGPCSYATEIEDALTTLGLPERDSVKPWEPEKEQCYIRHETGPEIIVLVTSLVSLATALVGLWTACRNSRPDTKLQITVTNADELKKVLDVLGK